MNMKQKLMELALPMSLEGLLSASADFLDTLMVSSLGEVSVSAVGLGTQLFFIQAMTLYGFSGGASTYMSQFWGNRNLSGIRKTLGTTVGCSLAVSLPLFLLVILIPERILCIFTNVDAVIAAGAAYMLYRSPCLIIYSIRLPVIMALKSIQQVRLPVGANIAAIVLNVSLNYMLIFGKFGAPQMGIAGAALATTISLTAELLLLFAGMMVLKSPLLQEARSYFRPNRELVGRLIKNSVPTTINETMWSGGMSAYHAAYGRIGVTASAAAQAADIVTHIFTKTIYSVGDASLIIVGEQLGKNEKNMAWKAAVNLLKINTLLGAAGGGILIVIAYPLSEIFGFAGESSSYLIALLCIYGLFMPLKVYNISIITGILRAGGDVRYAMVTEVSAIWCISVPLVFTGALVFGFPVYVVALFAETEDLVKAAVLTRRFLSKKWINNKVEDILC